MFYSVVNKKGFTLIELLVVVSILAIISAFTISGFKNFANFQQYNQAVNSVEFIINQTKLSARSAESDASHGVKFSSNSITQFVGDAYSAGDSNNVVTTFQLVTFTPTIVGGGDEIIFKKLLGLPSPTGTIAISGVSFSAVTNIEITDTGVVQ